MKSAFKQAKLELRRGEWYFTGDSNCILLVGCGTCTEKNCGSTSVIAIASSRSLCFFASKASMSTSTLAKATHNRSNSQVKSWNLHEELAGDYANLWTSGHPFVVPCSWYVSSPSNIENKRT